MKFISLKSFIKNRSRLEIRMPILNKKNKEKKKAKIKMQK